MFILRAIINAHLLRGKSPLGEAVSPLAFYHVQGGGCDICRHNLRRLYAPDSDAQTFGLNFVKTPYEADVLVVTGALTRVAVADILQIWTVMPAPKAIMAVGDCARGQDPFSAHYTILKTDLARLIPNVQERHHEIQGCPPTAYSIAQGLTAMSADVLDTAITG